MTVNEFIIKYHFYSTQDINEANKECEKVNQVLEVSELGYAVVKDFSPMGYCLMLKGSAKSIGF